MINRLMKLVAIKWSTTNHAYRTNRTQQPRPNLNKRTILDQHL